MQKVIIHCHLYEQAQNKSDYIPKDIDEISQLSVIKKIQAQEAIRWLLLKDPHSIEEIADHFEISPALVKELLEDQTLKLRKLTF